VKSSLIAFIIIAILVLAGAFILLRPTDTWIGLRSNGERESTNGVTYKTLDACKRDMEKVGGWCGRNCQDYGSGLIADCDPVLQVPKK
jgi:hypothetical protein